MPRSAPRRAAPTATLALSLALLGISLPAAAVAQDQMTTVSDKHMETILSDMDIDFTKSKDHTWKLTLDGHKVLLFLANDNTDAQLYIAFSDKTVSPSKMNEWNKSKRFSRAYADDDSNPALENDLDFAGGVTDATIKTWIRLYRNTVTQFIKFLNT